MPNSRETREKKGKLLQRTVQAEEIGKRRKQFLYFTRIVLQRQVVENKLDMKAEHARDRSSQKMRTDCQSEAKQNNSGETKRSQTESVSVERSLSQKS